MINMNLVRLKNQLDQVKGEVQARIDRSRGDDGFPNSDIFELKNPEIKQKMGDWVDDRTQEAYRLQAEIDDLLKAEGALESFEKLVGIGQERTKIAPIPTSSREPGLADQLMKSEEWGMLVDKKVKNLSWDSKMGMKALFETTTAGAADNVSVESVRTGDYVPAPRTRVTLLDLIPQTPTPNPVVKYDEETKNLSAAASIDQGATYQESEFTIEERSVDTDKSGTFIQVSEELLQDAPEMRARMDGALMSQLYRRIQADIIGGTLQNAAEFVTGAANNTAITGFLDIASANINEFDTQTGLASGEKKNEIEAIEEAVELVYRIGIAEADALLMNSQDWVKIKTLQSTTGNFILRGANAPLWEPARRMIDEWPVVLCNALPTGTIIVGAFREHSAIRDRQSVQVRIQEAQAIEIPAGSSAVTVQTKPSGRFNIFADVRYAFYARRGLAFTRVTNFGVPVP